MTGIPFIQLPVRLRTGGVLRLLFVVGLCIGTAGSVNKLWAVDFPFPVGEKLTYRISWSNFMEVGKVELLTLQASPSAPGTFRLQLKATTTPAITNIYPFKDEFMSLFDVALGSPAVSRRTSWNESGPSKKQWISTNLSVLLRSPFLGGPCTEGTHRMGNSESALCTLSHAES